MTISRFEELGRGLRVLLAALVVVYVALFAFALVGVGNYASYGSPLAYVVLGLCGLGLALHVAVMANASSWRVSALNLVCMLVLLAMTLVALMKVTGDSL
jgi:hypothetical protein